MAAHQRQGKSTRGTWMTHSLSYLNLLHLMRCSQQVSKINIDSIATNNFKKHTIEEVAWESSVAGQLKSLMNGDEWTDSQRPGAVTCVRNGWAFWMQSQVRHPF